YKNEAKLLKEFKNYVKRRKKKPQDKNIISDIRKSIDNRLDKLKSLEYVPKSPEYHPVSPSAQLNT
ncbi:11722_t:CDS:1, partial [Racocetra fulgida]